MFDWNGTGDEFIVDTDSRYPDFSDINKTDYAITGFPRGAMQPHSSDPIHSANAHKFSKHGYAKVNHSDNYIPGKYKNITPGGSIVRTYEDKFQREQSKLPAYYGCSCNECAQFRYRPDEKQPMRTVAIPHGSSSPNCRFAERMEPANASKPKTTAGEPVKLMNLSLDSSNIDSMLVFFLFIVMVFICCTYMRTIDDLRAQINTLTQLVNDKN